MSNYGAVVKESVLPLLLKSFLLQQSFCEAEQVAE